MLESYKASHLFTKRATLSSWKPETLPVPQPQTRVHRATILLHLPADESHTDTGNEAPKSVNFGPDQKKANNLFFYLRNDLVERLSFANEVLAQSQFFLGRFREHIFIYVGRTGFHPVLLHRNDLHAPKEKTLLDATNHIPHIRVRSFLHRLNQNNITRRN